MPPLTDRGAMIFSHAERLQSTLAEITLEEAAQRYHTMDTLISHMEKQLEKWRIERAILSRMVLSMDSGTPGYWEMVNILLGHYDVAAIGC